MQSLLKTYLNRLTNLSNNNRSILLNKLSQEQFIDIHLFNFVNQQSSFSIIEKIINKESNIFLCEEIDSRDKNVNILSQRLKSIERQNQFIFEDRGAKDLYLGWPFVQGKLLNDTVIRCPLIFFPVELQLIANKWTIKLRKDITINFNKSFLMAYSFYNKISLDEKLLDQDLGELDKNSTNFRTQLYNILEKSKLELNFNQELFVDNLKEFKNSTKEELKKNEKTGQLKLYPNAVLGIFPQAGSFLFPDYIHLIENTKFENFDEFFESKILKQNIRTSESIKEENTFTPFEIDEHQEKALHKIKMGESLVVQGPPGTGKSQLISNVISDYIARGKNVLLVCQKRVALDVVYNKLEKKDIHDFIALVHDFKNDRKDIFTKINNQIEKIDSYKQQNASLNIIQLERAFLQCCRNIENLIEKFTSYKKWLFDESECGKSVKELYLISNVDKPCITNFKKYLHLFHYDEVESFILKLNRYLKYHELFENEHNFFAFNNFQILYEPTDFIKLKNTVEETQIFMKDISIKSKDIFKNPLDYAMLDFLIHRKEKLDFFISLLSDDLVVNAFKNKLQSPPNEKIDWLNQIENSIFLCFENEGIEKTLSKDRIIELMKIVNYSLKIHKNFFKWFRWKLASINFLNIKWIPKEQLILFKTLKNNNLKFNKKSLKILNNKIDHRLNYEHNISRIKEKAWIKDFPNTYKSLEIKNWFFYQRNALNAYHYFKDINNIENHIDFSLNKNELLQQLNVLKNFINKYENEISKWTQIITKKQIHILLSSNVDIQNIKNQINTNFENLIDYQNLHHSFNESELEAIHSVCEIKGEIHNKIDCFKNSLAIGWIEYIESKHPELRTISSLQFQQDIQELKENVNKKKEITKEIILSKLREMTYSDLKYNRLQNRTTFRDLKHQVVKKKKLWSLRKIISEFTEEIFQLIPCWMASPESTSAIFPMIEMFDVVIFDEASQCFAERGIPAMFRGKQVIVIGDSKQLKPFDLYRPRFEDEEDENPDIEVESLLDLSSRYLKNTELKRHYRSKSEELITFSNQYFYNNGLNLLVDRYNLSKHKKPPIEYIKVDGVWENNVNNSEAEEILTLLEKLIKQSPEKSVGIVTFNAKQQTLIEDLIDEKRNLWTTFPKELFVKNIENVQGDERDIIIFSTAYSKDKKGKLQLRFGSLNNLGGENRMNVAITRAKEKMYLVTSILPHEIKIDHVKNEGPKVFAQFLEFALLVSQSKWEKDITKPKKSNIDWYLKNKVQQSFEKHNPDFKLQSDINFGDLSISKSNDYLALVVTDDDLFFESSSFKDWYVNLDDSLSISNWPFIRLNSRDFWVNKNSINTSIENLINRAERTKN